MHQTSCAKAGALLLCVPLTVLLLAYLMLTYVLAVLLTLLYAPRVFVVSKIYW